jgi:hypothetical protein
VSTPAVPARREGQGETVAGILAALAIFMSLIAVARTPVRIAPVAILVALVAVGMAQGRSQKLAAWALVAAGAGWLLGMTIAVATDSPLF